MKMLRWDFSFLCGFLCDWIGLDGFRVCRCHRGQASRSGRRIGSPVQVEEGEIYATARGNRTFETNQGIVLGKPFRKAFRTAHRGESEMRIKAPFHLRTHRNSGRHFIMIDMQKPGTEEGGTTTRVDMNITQWAGRRR